ncbi:thiamine diphosphokinase [Gilliamella sp. ESL0443]|uniref:thiamine diphosphokinase n=1 Tax=Gilliamella sp. ESL0443 TaxID=2704655 RepID=UPI001C6A837E|nr:thiamine diphosphokinase [Gilliamella sp. ESL0443]QYN41778.1 thiamine diphosphokinase [Gilliamella sp. ESL0443]
MFTALLFVNGEPPKNLPSHLGNYNYIACTDGAYHSYLSKSSIKPDFIIGDLDSINSNMTIPDKTQIIHTPDQSKTDFEKALLFLNSKGVTSFTIYGASGRASDHFLGNLSVAMQYHQQLKMLFYDDYCHFFFATNHQIIRHVKYHIISLMPLSKVTGLTITGFEYPLHNQTLSLGSFTSLRNKAINDTIEISFNAGDLLIFVQN